MSKRDEKGKTTDAGEKPCGYINKVSQNIVVSMRYVIEVK